LIWSSAIAILSSHAATPHEAAREISAFLIAALSLCCLLPFALAYARRHPDVAAIGVVNLAFGWTLVGWGVALVWANLLGLHGTPPP
jgi:hypothetical protein